MVDFRRNSLALLRALTAGAGDNGAAAATAALAEDAVFDVSAPVGRLSGRGTILDGFLRPLAGALEGLARRDEIFIGGDNIRAEGGRWVASVTHYTGNFAGPLFGLPPSGHLAFLRAGEFYRLGPDGRITKAHIILDLVDLARQAGRMPLAASPGTEMLFPAPATHDGVLPSAGDGAASLELVERMLADLRDFDPADFSSNAQTGPDGCWAEDMFWYGPGGIGSNHRWEGFVADHRAGFLSAFPDRVGGNHFCRIGDGNYAAVSGWPSMTMTHRGPYLGQPATGRSLMLRVMDFYRCAGGRIAENWVLLDYIDLFAQMGRDLIAEAAALPAPGN